MKHGVAQLGLGSRIELLGQLPPDEIAELYRTHDALLFPVVWDEPWGLVPLEAMASGCPVIATGRGGSGEYLQDGVNCLLVPDADPKRLAAAVMKLAGSEELRNRIRHRAPKRRRGTPSRVQRRRRATPEAGERITMSHRRLLGRVIPESIRATARRAPRSVGYVHGPKLMSWLRKQWVLARHPHAHIHFGRDVYLGPGFSLDIRDCGTFIAGDRTEFRRGFRAEVAGDGRLVIGADCHFTYYVLIQCSTLIEIGDRCMFGQSTS